MLRLRFYMQSFQQHGFATWTRPLYNKHGANMLEFLRSSGTLDFRPGPVKIVATPWDAQREPRTSLPPNTKILHFQRHGQGFHNFIYTFVQEDLEVSIPPVYEPDPVKNVLFRQEVLDAPLTELGRQQCSAQRELAASLDPQIVFVSPLQRAIQTAQISFADFQHKVPFCAHSACREEMGLLVCNQRRPLSETELEFPYIDFSMIDEADEDTLFDPHAREPPQAQSQRIYDFLTQVIQPRPEQEIAVVGHSAWFFNMCHVVLDCDHQQYPQLSKWFATAEVRSMKLTFSNV
eukprot:Nitzschia sp. Nitz4//scaffold9_size221794//106997//107869//NITZ4_001351-RA/size221794-processed-gene-0.328-mRNA-1//-1//CDS//3329561016//6277//frame0